MRCVTCKSTKSCVTCKSTIVLIQHLDLDAANTIMAKKVPKQKYNPPSGRYIVPSDRLDKLTAVQNTALEFLEPLPPGIAESFSRQCHSVGTIVFAALRSFDCAIDTSNRHQIQAQQLRAYLNHASRSRRI
jgi:hypothetical protein